MDKIEDARACLLWCLLFLVVLLGYTVISVAHVQPKQVHELFKISPEKISLAVSKINPPMRMDSIRHGVFGLILGLFTFDPIYTIFSIFTSVFLDLDHVPFLIGLHVPGRISHSLIFLFVANLTYFFFFKKKEVNVALTSSFLLHIALDRLKVPLLSPITMNPAMPAWLCPIFIVTAFFLNLIFLGRSQILKWLKRSRCL